MVGEDLRDWPLRYSVTVEVDPRSALVRGITAGLPATAVAAVRPPAAVRAPVATQRPSARRRSARRHRRQASRGPPEE